MKPAAKDVEKDKLHVFGGSANPKLLKAICRELDIPPGESEMIRFDDGNLFVRILENVRGRNAYLVQSTTFPVNDHFMELIFWIDAFKRASASSVTAVVPYFSYAKGDKKDEPRVSIRARVCADAIEAAGVDRVVTMDLHAPQIQGFFKVPVDDLYALQVICDEVEKLELDDPVVVSPDLGFMKKARQYASCLKTPLATADKERLNHKGKMVIHDIIGEVAGRTVLIVDDFTVSGGTLVDTARALKANGANRIIACLSHVIVREKGIKAIEDSPIEMVIGSDSVRNPYIMKSDKFVSVSVAALFAEAVLRIHEKESVSPLFSKVPKRVVEEI